VLLLLVTFSPLNGWWTGWLSDSWDKPAGDVMILLGGDTVDEKTLGQMSFWRCVYAVWLWREGNIRQVIISGGGKEAIAGPMADYLMSHGVPRDVIVIESASRSTRENALNTAALVRPGSRPVLVTSDFHMLRARRALRKAGVETDAYPVPDAIKQNNSWRLRWSVFLLLAEETTKLAWYRWQGWI
jgi:uncharacterized SAM-binding protein YcdF (DUF218 family)